MLVWPIVCFPGFNWKTDRDYLEQSPDPDPDQDRDVTPLEEKI